MNLTNAEWTRLSIGDIKGLLKKAEEDNNSELKEFLQNRQEHSKDKDLYKSLYGWGKNQHLNFPPEYFYKGVLLGGRLERVLDLINRCQAKSVLDVGSRAGFLLFAGVLRNIIDYGTGVEVDTSHFNLCLRAKGVFKDTKLEFFNCLFEDFISDKKYDCVVIAEVLEHVANPLDFLKRARSFLNSTGHLILTVPISRPPVSSIELSFMRSEKMQEHLNFFRRSDLLALTQEAGFKCLNSITVSNGWLIDITVYGLE